MEANSAFRISFRVAKYLPQDYSHNFGDQTLLTRNMEPLFYTNLLNIYLLKSI